MWPLLMAAAFFTCWHVSIAVITADAQTQQQMSQDACQEMEQIQGAVDAAYRQILNDYGENTQFTRKLTEAQQAWTAFRDAHVEAIYPEHDKQAEYGSTYKLCRCIALTELTKHRLQELRRWVVGVNEGDVCRGSARLSERDETD